MEVFICLFFYSGNNFGMRMSQRIGRNSGDKIQVFFPVGSVNVTALRLGDFKTGSKLGSLCLIGEELFLHTAKLRKTAAFLFINGEDLQLNVLIVMKADLSSWHFHYFVSFQFVFQFFYSFGKSIVIIRGNFKNKLLYRVQIFISK